MPDYFRFVAMLAHGGEVDGIRHLRQSTVRQMTVNHLTGPAYPVRFGKPWTGMGYGLGVGVYVESDPTEGSPFRPSLFGWIGISGTEAWVDPREELTVLVMAQSRDNWAVGDLLRELAYKAVRG